MEKLSTLAQVVKMLVEGGPLATLAILALILWRLSERLLGIIERLIHTKNKS